MSLTAAYGAKPVATVDDLLSLHDEDFVRAAYLAILGREVDPSGLANFLAHVRSGIPKIDIVVQIARSPEARQRTVRLPGLERLVKGRFFSRHSLLARVARRLLLRRGLWRLETHLNRIENQIGALGKGIPASAILSVATREGRGASSTIVPVSLDHLNERARCIYQRAALLRGRARGDQ